MSSDPGEIVADAVGRGVVPSAVLRYGRGADGPVRGGAFGTDADTVYDLASLTKVTATLPLVLRLVEEGEIGLDDPVVRYLPGFATGGTGTSTDAGTGTSPSGGAHPSVDTGTGLSGGTATNPRTVTIRHLLAHNSGLPAHREVWRLPGTAEDRFAAVLAEPLETPPGTTVRYSDLGFILLGRIVADVVGQPLDRAFAELVGSPLGLASTGYRPVAGAAATEANWFDDPGRQDPKAGVVHDENAESLGGVAGHAGLFGTASDVASYLTGGWLASDSPISGPTMRAEALRCQTPGLDGVRGLGWTLRGDSYDFMSDAWPPGGAGHTGFTGTSVAFDPDSGIWCVLLTNAVLFGRENRTRELRRALHAAVAAEFGLSSPTGLNARSEQDPSGSRITA